MTRLHQTHSILLHLLDELPQTEADALRFEIAALHSKMVEQLVIIENTNNCYEAVASRIRAKASLQKRKLKNFALISEE